jgi:mRNA interferase RelE/StbE
MASYSVEVSETAERQLRRLQKRDRASVLAAIADLARAPRPPGCRKLTGFDDVWRIRVGTHRVLYSIEDRRLIVIILKVGHRKDIYR